MSYISCDNLSLGYEGKSILDNISFKADKGDYLCVLGENGAGKSTLLKTILGMNMPIDGLIEFGDGLCKQDIGYLPQQTEVQRDFPASVEEIVYSGLQSSHGLRLFYSKEEKELVRRSMERMDIVHLAKSCYRELSGGQQQRVLLARALCATKKVLVLDEPVSGLDPRVSSNLYSLISELNKEGIAIIMISHDLQAALKYASHILYLCNKPFFGTKEEFIESKQGKIFMAMKDMEDN